MKNFPSIFNDVIGPVMRGPSSSHCAASVRIGWLARDLMGGEIRQVRIEFDPNGSLATTHESQGSDMGLFGGLLGWEPTDPRLVSSAEAIRECGITVQFAIVAHGDIHPNTYRLALENPKERHSLVAVSTGGGMLEIIDIDGFAVSIEGDCFETLVFLAGGGEAARERLKAHGDSVVLHQGESGQLLQVKGGQFLDAKILKSIAGDFALDAVRMLRPVLPILSCRKSRVPFITCDEMLAYNADRKLALWELAAEYESARGGITTREVFERMQALVGIIRHSIRQGLGGTEFHDRILGAQSPKYLQHLSDGRLLDGGVLNRIIPYVAALMEVKSAMGVIVAAPTAGSCGGLPGACIGAADAMGLPEEEMTRGMLAAGLIGVFFSAHSTFAAEVGGCQAECGAASGMAAAALTTLMGGTVAQALSAASMALQNSFGMVCDPVANRVEVPCLGKNVMAAANALACANMALAGFDAVVPLDQVIRAMDKVGRSLPGELRCTALGGLSLTEASREISRRLK